MDLISKEVVDLLTYLLPGFIAAAILYNLTPNPRPEPFERLVQALIYTVIIQVLVLFVAAVLSWFGEHIETFGTWTDNSRLVWSVLIALALGLALARSSNYDTLHGLLRRLRITHQTSYSSEWYGTFAQNEGYVVLHLTGERRLYGWAEEWPSTPERGHFVIVQAEWLDGDERTPLTGVDRILVDVSDVAMVEFMDRVTSPDQDEEHGRSKGADATTGAAATD